jgi:hypothetical protein
MHPKNSEYPFRINPQIFMKHFPECLHKPRGFCQELANRPRAAACRQIKRKPENQDFQLIETPAAFQTGQFERTVAFSCQ